MLKLLDLSLILLMLLLGVLLVGNRQQGQGIGILGCLATSSPVKETGTLTVIANWFCRVQTVGLLGPRNLYWIL